MSVSSTDSSVSLQIVDEVEGEPGEKGRSAFEGLQNTLYSEVITKTFYLVIFVIL